MMTQTLPPSLAMTPQLLFREPGSVEPCWGVIHSWGGTLQNWILLMSSPLKGFCGVEQHEGCSVGPLGAIPTASCCMNPAALRKAQGEGIHISAHSCTVSF